VTVLLQLNTSKRPAPRARFPAPGTPRPVYLRPISLAPGVQCARLPHPAPGLHARHSLTLAAILLPAGKRLQLHTSENSTVFLPLPVMHSADSKSAQLLKSP